MVESQRPTMLNSMEMAVVGLLLFWAAGAGSNGSYDYLGTYGELLDEYGGSVVTTPGATASSTVVSCGATTTLTARTGVPCVASSLPAKL